MLDIRAEHEFLLSQLLARQDAAYRAGSAMVMKTRLHIYGVRTPDLRAIVRSWCLAHREAPWSAVLDLIDRLWEAPSQEERALAVLLLERNASRVPDLTRGDFDRWRKLIDNWGLSDGLGVLAVGPWLAADFASRKKYLHCLIADSDVWSRRLALVATVPLNRRPATAVPLVTFRLIETVIHERDPMITKAVSWALREMTKTAKGPVTEFLEANRDRLAPLAVREVENKLRTGLKNPRRGAKA